MEGEGGVQEDGALTLDAWDQPAAEEEGQNGGELARWLAAGGGEEDADLRNDGAPARFPWQGGRIRRGEPPGALGFGRGAL